MQYRTIEELGPGMWFTLHFEAKFAITTQLKDEYENRVQRLALNFPCAKCRPHFQQLLKELPLTLFRNIINEAGEDVGFFKWSVLAHNTVNARLGKKEYTFEQAYIFWYPVKGAGGSVGTGGSVGVEGCPQCFDPMAETTKELSFQPSVQPVPQGLLVPLAPPSPVGAPSNQNIISYDVTKSNKFLQGKSNKINIVGRR